MAQQLYAPEKYQVIEGKDTGIALCTCWSDPRSLVTEHPELKNHFSLIGSLYSVGGIGVVIRNLALLPSLHTVVVWPYDELSRTALGRRGWETLFKMWRGECWHLLDTQITHDVLNELISTVFLVQGESMSMEQLKSYAGRHVNQSVTPRRDSYRIPAPSRPSQKSFPSEGVGFTFRGSDIQEAWTHVVRGIHRYGHIKGTDYGSKQRELKCVTWVIEAASLADELKNSDSLGYSPEALREYATQFLTSSSFTGVSYTYGKRLRDYKGYDQVASMAAALQRRPMTRRAFASTLMPEVDAESDLPPCLTQVQALVDDALHLVATFRSQDCFKAGIPNAFALLGLLDHLAGEVGIPAGSLSITVGSAHIYEEDWEQVPAVSSGKDTFRPDPRGDVLITLNEGNIEASLCDRDGNRVFEVRDTDAWSIAQRFADEHLLSDPSHYCYLAFELSRAENALAQGISYVQDHPL